MENTELEKYYHAVTDTWQIFKRILTDFEPNEDYIAKAAEWLLTDDDADSFTADIRQACLSELYRLTYKENPYTDILLLSRAVERVSQKYGVNAKIIIETKNKNMEIKG